MNTCIEYKGRMYDFISVWNVQNKQTHSDRKNIRGCLGEVGMGTENDCHVFGVSFWLVENAVNTDCDDDFTIL